MNKGAIILCFLITIIEWTACSPDNIENKIEELPSRDRIIVLDADDPFEDSFAIGDTPMLFYLTPEESNQTQEFPGILNISKEKDFNSSARYKCQFLIAVGNANVSDGFYDLRIETEDNTLVADYFVVLYADKLSLTPRKYEFLEGDGTQNLPYLLRTNEELKQFLDSLASDRSHAYGLHFRLNADMAPEFKMGSFITSETCVPSTFAGNLDGQKHAIRGLENVDSLTRTGLTGGLFRTLSNATISNLTLKDAKFKFNADTCGIVAGMAKGRTVLTNVEIDGKIEAANCIGMLFGHSSDVLELNSVKSTGVMKGHDRVGGLIGCAVDSLKIYDIESDADVEGTTETGGVIGSLRGVLIGNNIDSNGNTIGANMTGGLIGHASGEISVQSVYGNGGIKGADMTGGVIGCYDMTTAQPVFQNIKINNDLQGENMAGGIFGYIDASNSPNLKDVTIRRSYFNTSRKIKGCREIGGIAGRMEKGVFIMEGEWNLDIIDEFSYYGITSFQEFHPGLYADKYAGAIAGWADFNGQTMDTSVVELTLTTYYEVKEGFAGGLFGYLTNGKFDAKDGRISYGKDAYTTIDSEGPAVGGLVGHLDNARLVHNPAWTGASHLPQSPVEYVEGRVSGTNEVGGAVGRMSGSSQNTGISGFTIKVKAGGSQSGGIVGHLAGGDVSSCLYTGSAYEGGIVGMIDAPCRIEACCNFNSSANGGIVGVIDAKQNFGKSDKVIVSKCINLASIRSRSYIGGIVGKCLTNSSDEDILISECENYGEISLDEESTYAYPECSIGGIVGIIEGAGTTVSRCNSHGRVYTKARRKAVGGVVGTSEGTVIMCLNSGVVGCESSGCSIGGMVGETAGSAKILGCVNWMSLYNSGGCNLGGIVGKASARSEIAWCWNNGTVTDGNALIGGSGSSYSFISKGNYYLEGTGNGWPNGHPVREVDIAKNTSYPELNFTQPEKQIIMTMSTNGPVPKGFRFFYWRPSWYAPSGWKLL